MHPMAKQFEVGGNSSRMSGCMGEPWDFICAFLQMQEDQNPRSENLQRIGDPLDCPFDECRTIDHRKTHVDFPSTVKVHDAEEQVWRSECSNSKCSQQRVAALNQIDDPVQTHDADRNLHDENFRRYSRVWLDLKLEAYNQESQSGLRFPYALARAKTMAPMNDQQAGEASSEIPNDQDSDVDDVEQNLFMQASDQCEKSGAESGIRSNSTNSIGRIRNKTLQSSEDTYSFCQKSNMIARKRQQRDDKEMQEIHFLSTSSPRVEQYLRAAAESKDRVRPKRPLVSKQPSDSDLDDYTPAIAGFLKKRSFSRSACKVCRPHSKGVFDLQSGKAQVVESDNEDWAAFNNMQNSIDFNVKQSADGTSSRLKSLALTLPENLTASTKKNAGTGFQFRSAKPETRCLDPQRIESWQSMPGTPPPLTRRGVDQYETDDLGSYSDHLSDFGCASVRGCSWKREEDWNNQDDSFCYSFKDAIEDLQLIGGLWTANTPEFKPTNRDFSDIYERWWSHGIVSSRPSATQISDVEDLQNWEYPQDQERVNQPAPWRIRGTSLPAHLRLEVWQHRFNMAQRSIVNFFESCRVQEDESWRIPPRVNSEERSTYSTEDESDEDDESAKVGADILNASIERF